MRFHSVPVFDFLKPRMGKYLDLASSGMYGVKDTGELGLQLGPIPLNEENFYGWKPLRELIASRFGLSEECVAITAGASTANFALLAALVEEGDRVAVEVPGYQPLHTIAHLLSGQEALPFYRLPDERYQVNIERWQELKPHPKVTFLTNLHNPTGIWTPPHLISQLAEEAEKVGGWVIVDEIFLPFKEGSQWTTSALSSPNLFATGSLTKVWGLGGLRVGWVLASPPVIKRVFQVLDHIYVVNPFPTEFLAYQILTQKEIEDKLLFKAWRRARENLMLVMEMLERASGISYHPPDGGIILFCRIRGESDSLCEHLLTRHGVLVQPGRYFKDATGFRIGFGADPETVKMGLGALLEVWNEFATEGALL